MDRVTSTAVFLIWFLMIGMIIASKWRQESLMEKLGQMEKKLDRIEEKCNKVNCSINISKGE